MVGKPDAERTEIVKAFVVLRKVSRPLANWPKNCANMSVNGFHAYAHPREIEFMERLPRTPSGKLQRFILRN